MKMTRNLLIACSLLFPFYSGFAQSAGLEMISVEGGSFSMGCQKCSADASPVHLVTLAAFSIGKYEVTQKQWMAVMGKNPAAHKDCDNCPVENVSYDDVQLFLKKLNEMQPGKNYRLPTEAEWEYAASGGKTRHGYRYSGSNNLADVAYFRDNSDNTSHPVGEKTPNELGIYDMSGNVREWVSDWYDASYYQQSPSIDPRGPKDGEFIVFRGGSWSDGPNNCLTAARFNEFSGERSSFTGFRIARTN